MKSAKSSLVSTALSVIVGLACVACEQRSAPPPESAQSGAKGVPMSPSSPPEREPSRPANSGQGPAAPTQTLTPAARMEFHNTEAEAMRRAVIAGDFLRASEAAKALSEDNWTRHLKPMWKEHMSQMYGAAKDYSAATDLAGAAAAVSKLGLACAGCHQVLGGPKVEANPAAAPDASMQGHAWAVERLWLGLVAPNDAAWLEGAQQLSKSPAVRSDVGAVDKDAVALQGLGNKALTATAGGRARVLSEVLATCASCHRKVGFTP